MFNSLLPAPEAALHRWQGASGQWYFFSIYSLHGIPDWLSSCCCNYIFASPRHGLTQAREPFYIGEKGDTDRFANHEKLKRALALGATELHVCFTAESKWHRLDIETDLRNGHRTPLNEQPTRAPEPVNALAGLGAFAVPSSGGLAGALGYLPPASLNRPGIVGGPNS